VTTIAPLDSLVLLPPRALEPSFVDRELGAARTLDALGSALALPLESARAILEREWRVSAGTATWPLVPDFDTGTSLKRSAAVELDDYMLVRRVDSDSPGATWCTSVVQAALAWVSLLPYASADPVELVRLGRGFGAMLELAARAFGLTTSPVAVHPDLQRGGGAPVEDQALLEVWRRGHWIFFVLTQALTIAFRRVGSELRRGRVERAELELATATELLWAAGASMKLTGAFTNAQYHRAVRPTMTLGDQAALVKTTSLSGAMTWDHHYLVSRVWREDLMPLLAQLPDGLRGEYDRFLRAYREGLSAGHRSVCAKFGGEAMGSLVAPHHIAVDLIDKIEATRLSQLAPTSPLFTEPTGNP
jgi:hypothetical protein